MSAPYSIRTAQAIIFKQKRYETNYASLLPQPLLYSCL